MTTSTPWGMGMGFLPIRDMGAPLPDLTEDLAAHSTLPRLTVGHQSLVGRQNRDAHAPEHAGHGVGLRVHAQPRLRDALQARDRALAVLGVLEHDLELAAGTRVVVL